MRKLGLEIKITWQPKMLCLKLTVSAKSKMELWYSLDNISNGFVDKVVLLRTIANFIDRTNKQ